MEGMIVVHKKILTTSLAMALTVPVWLTAAFPDGGQVAEAATKKTTKKAKAVINKIKAINSKKTNYIAKTRAANNAYKKLSTTDKKLVSNYSTLKKHVAKIAPLEKKITTLKAQVNSITTKNYVTQAVKAQKTYDGLTKITQAAVPAATVKKLEKYASPAKAQASYKRVVNLLALTDEDGNSEVDVPDSTGGAAEDGGTFVPNKTELVKELKTFLASYKTLDTFQKGLFTEDETASIQAYLVDEAKINDTVDIINVYEKLQPSAGNYETKAFEAALAFGKFLKEFEAEDTQEYFDTPIYEALEKLVDKYQPQVDKISAFEEAVRDMQADLSLSTIYEAEQKYKELSSPGSTINLTKYIEKDLLKSYQDYAKVPAFLGPLSKVISYEEVTEEEPIPTKKDLDSIKAVQALYKGLGKEQQAFTLDLMRDDADTSSDYEFDVAQAIANLPYVLEEADVKAAEKIDSSYTKAYNKSDLQGMIDTSILYGSALPQVKKYVLFGKEIAVVQDTYAEQILDIQDFEKLLNDLNTLNGYENAGQSDVLSALENLEDAYKALQQKKIDNPGKPAAVDMLSKETTKDYELYMTIPALIRTGVVLAEDLNRKPYNPGTAELKVEEKDFKYNTNDEERIVAFAKVFNKLTDPQKTLVALSIDLTRKNDATPIARVWGSEAALVSQAQKIDASILKLATGSKSFAADVKKVYNQYKSAPPKVKKYVINQERLHWFNGLVSKTSGNYPQAIANKFTEYVGKLNTKTAIDAANTTGGATPLTTVVDYYNTMIEHDTSTQSIIEKSVMTKYNKYLEAYNVVGWIAATDIQNPTEQDIKNIQKAIALYDKMAVGPKNAVVNSFKPTGGAETEQAKVLGKVDEIKAATEIDKAYQKLKPSSPTYKVDLIKLYTTYSNASDTVRKYVAAKKALEQVKTDYEKEYLAAMDFKAEVDKLTSTSGIGDVNKLKEYYEKNVESNEVIRAFVPENTFADFEKFMYLIDIQDVARYNHFFNYWCANDDILSYDYLYVSLTQEDLVKVFKKYNKMDAEQKGIIAASPHRTDAETGNACYIPGKDAASQEEEKKVMRDTSFLASAQYLDAATKIDKMYEALKPSDKNYVQKVMEVVNAYENANDYTKPFVKHAEDIMKLKEKYKKDFESLQKMERMIKSLAIDSPILGAKYAENADGSNKTPASVNDVYDAYNRLPSYIQPVIEADLLKKYKEYILLLDIQVPELRADEQALTPTSERSTITTAEAYTPLQMMQLKNAISTYNKLGTLQKTIAQNDTTLNDDSSPNGSNEDLLTYVLQEKYIKEANSMDATYDKFVKKYGAEPYEDANPSTSRPPLVGKDAQKYATELKALVLAYEKLSNNATYYLQNVDGFVTQAEAFNDAYSVVEDFERQVAALDSRSTLEDVEAVVALYNDLSDYQKAWIDSKVLARYNELAPIVKIRDNLALLPAFDPDEDAADPENFTDTESTLLKEAIDLYSKLNPEAKGILNAAEVDNREYLTDEYDIAAADKTDKLIDSVKIGNTFFKQYVTARKTYDALTKKQKQYVKNKAKLAKYDKYVDKVQYNYTFNGSAEISYKEESSYNPYEMIIMFEELINYLDEEQASQTNDTKEDYLKDAIDMANIRNGLNRMVKINGVSLKPLNAADTKAQTRYHYYYKVFDMKNQLKNFKKVFPK